MQMLSGFLPLDCVVPRELTFPAFEKEVNSE
jgi:hypothetical protein